MPQCEVCNEQKGFLEMSAEKGICKKCLQSKKHLDLEIDDTELRVRRDEALKSGDLSSMPLKQLHALTSKIILTTSIEVANRQVEHEIEIITAECVFGMNVFRDFFAGVRDFFGGRSAATQKVLRDARKTALTELRREAALIGADAVIAVDIDYQELSGGSKNGMLMIVASGTAVRLRDGRPN